MAPTDVAPPVTGRRAGGALASDMRLILGSLLVAGSLVVLAPFAGGWLPPLDSLAIISPYMAAALLLAAVLIRRVPGFLRAGSGIAALAALVPVAALAIAPATATGPGLRLLQHNILFSNDGRLFPEVIQGHDVATFQEVQSVWTALRTLPDPWVGLDCPEAEGIGTAVATRLPIVARGCLDDGEAWVRVASPIGEVTVLSMHLQWPWPANGGHQARQVDALSRQIANLPKPVIIGGDFNQMPWSAAASRIARAAGGHVTQGLRATYINAAGTVRLPIDHVIIPDGWSANTAKGPRYLSDHNTVTAHIVAGK